METGSVGCQVVSVTVHDLPFAILMAAGVGRSQHPRFDGTALERVRRPLVAHRVSEVTTWARGDEFELRLRVASSWEPRVATAGSIRMG